MITLDTAEGLLSFPFFKGHWRRSLVFMGVPFSVKQRTLVKLEISAGQDRVCNLLGRQLC